MRTQMRQLERNNISLDMSSDEATIAKGVSPEIVADCLQNASNSTLILDCRPFMAFNEKHIKHSSNVHCPPILKRRSNGFVSLENIVPCERQRRNLQDGHYRNVIICDADTVDLSSPAKDSNLNSVIKSLKQQVEINDIMFLIGGFGAFEEEYPNMCISQNGNSPSTLSLPVRTRTHSHEVGPVEILPGLFLGDSMHSSQQDLLKEMGITSLLNVSTGKNFFESEFEYMNIPVNDNDTADLSCWFQQAINFIDNARDSGGKVLVHCHAGISRSATVCIAYLMYKNNDSLEKAFDHVRSRRGVISPNLNFMQQLQEFEKDICGANSYELTDSVSSLSTSLESVQFDFSSSSRSSDFSASSGAFDFTFASVTSSPAVPRSPQAVLSSS